MNKTLSRVLFLFGIIAMLVGAGILIYAFSGNGIRLTGNGLQANGDVIASHVTHPFWATIGAIVAFFGYLLGLIAWMGALARMAQFSRWIWFVCLIIIPGLAMLAYVFFGPRTPSRRVQAPKPITAPPPYPGYGD